MARPVASLTTHSAIQCGSDKAFDKCPCLRIAGKSQQRRLKGTLAFLTTYPCLIGKPFYARFGNSTRYRPIHSDRNFACPDARLARIHSAASMFRMMLMISVGACQVSLFQLRYFACRIKGPEGRHVMEIATRKTTIRATTTRVRRFVIVMLVAATVAFGGLAAPPPALAMPMSCTTARAMFRIYSNMSYIFYRQGNYSQAQYYGGAWPWAFCRLAAGNSAESIGKRPPETTDSGMPVTVSCPPLA